MIHSVKRFVFKMEIIAATHLGAVGDLWAANAAQRLGKISGEPAYGADE